MLTLEIAQLAKIAQIVDKANKELAIYSLTISSTNIELYKGDMRLLLELLIEISIDSEVKISPKMRCDLHKYIVLIAQKVYAAHKELF